MERRGWLILRGKYSVNGKRQEAPIARQAFRRSEAEAPRGLKSALLAARMLCPTRYGKLGSNIKSLPT